MCTAGGRGVGILSTVYLYFSTSMCATEVWVLMYIHVSHFFMG